MTRKLKFSPKTAKKYLFINIHTERQKKTES